MSRRRWRKHTTALVLLAAVATSLTAALFARPEMFAAYDAVTHLHWSHGFTEALQEGSFYPRWHGGALSGRGAPVWVYYPALPYYASALFEGLFGFGAVSALKLSVGVAIFSSGCTFYFFLRTHLDGASSLLGALGYVLLPGHLFQIAPLFFYASLWSFAWLPIAFSGVERVARGAGGEILAIGVGGLLATHLPTSATALPVIAAYALCVAPRRWWRILVGLAWGFALAGIYWIPAISERGLVFSEMFTQWNRFEDNFLFASASLREDGWLAANQLLSAGAAATAMLAGIAVLGMPYTGGDRRRGWFFAVIGLAAFGLMLPWSEAVWRLVPGRAWLPVPWRLQTLQVLATSAAMAFSLDGIGAGAHGRRVRAAIVGSTCGWLLVVAAGGVFVLWSVPFMTPARTADALETGVFEVGQYRPKTAHPPEARLILATRAAAPRAHLALPGDLQWQRWNHADKRLHVDTSVPNRLVVEFFAFPGWHVEVNGSGARLGVETDSGLIQVSLGPGSHDIRFVFQDTATRASARGVSLLACFVLLAMIVWDKIRSARDQARQSQALTGVGAID